MGYTHYWNAEKVTKLDKKCVLVLAKMLKTFYKEGEIQYESDEPLAPVVTSMMVRFNGVEEQGHETFLLVVGEREFCKTNEKPYDAVVVAALVIIKHFHPEFSWSSDGGDKDHEKGCEIAKEFLDVMDMNLE